MPRPIRIAPSILSADFGRLAAEVQAIDSAGADYIHIDVMDGHFVPNLTIGPPIISAVRKATSKLLDVHLMISNADLYLKDYADAGADLICVHAEACTHLHRTVQAIRGLGKKAAVSLNPATPLAAVEHVLPDLDMVLLMSVNPGFGGQSFIPQVLPKIAALHALISSNDLDVDIEVDGGVKVDNVAAVAKAGANVIVSGSGIFKTGDYVTAIREMREQAQRAQQAQ